MKKLLAAIWLTTVITLVHAQGWIEDVGAAANIQTNTAIGTFFGGPGTGGTDGRLASSSAPPSPVYDFELLYATTTITGNSAPTNSAWAPVLAYGGGSLAVGTNGAAAGSLWGPGFIGGIQVNLAAETPYSVELVGWDSAMGNYAEMLSIISSGQPFNDYGNGGYLGWTSVGTITPQSTQGPDPTLFATVWADGTMTLNVIYPAPEPSVVALAGLGGLALLGLRRRKTESNNPKN